MGRDTTYQIEHDVLFSHRRRTVNNGEYMARSTMMGIMGQASYYTGEEITWDKINASDSVTVQTEDCLTTEPPCCPLRRQLPCIQAGAAACWKPDFYHCGAGTPLSRFVVIAGDRKVLRYPPIWWCRSLMQDKSGGTVHNTSGILHYAWDQVPALHRLVGVRRLAVRLRNANADTRKNRRAEGRCFFDCRDFNGASHYIRLVLHPKALRVLPPTAMKRSMVMPI